MSWHGVITNGTIVLEDEPCLPEGAHVEVQVIEQSGNKNRSASEILAEIAAMPTEEGPSFTGRDHDQILYGDRGSA